MILNYTNLDNVIAKIQRDTGIQHADLISDLVEWIPEAMAEMEIQLELAPMFKTVPVNFHAAKIPCGMTRVLAISYCGFRLPFNNRDNDPRTRVAKIGPDSVENPNSIFQTDPMNVEYNPVQEKGRRWPYPLPARNQIHQTASYQIKGGHVWTSFPYGEITIHGEASPADENGLPLVPDNMAFREAIYYHARGKLVGSGRYKDPAFSMDSLLGMYEKYAARAIEQISYPSPDQMAKMVDNWVRLIPAANYFENFSDPGGPEPFYDTYGQTKSLWQEI